MRLTSTLGMSPPRCGCVPAVGGCSADQAAAVYRNFDWNGPLKFAQKAGGLSDNIWGVTKQAAE